MQKKQYKVVQNNVIKAATFNTLLF
jgi:hypothetical protein